MSAQVFKMATKMVSREKLEESKGKRTLSSSPVNKKSSDSEESSSEGEVERKKRKKKKRMKQKKRGKENKKAGEKSKVKWSNEKIFRLMELYEERPWLWDVFSRHYHIRKTTSKAKSELEISLIVLRSYKS